MLSGSRQYRRLPAGAATCSTLRNAALEVTKVDGVGYFRQLGCIVVPQTRPLIRLALLVRIYVVKSRNGEFMPEDESRLAYHG